MLMCDIIEGKNYKITFCKVSRKHTARLNSLQIKEGGRIYCLSNNALGVVFFACGTAVALSHEIAKNIGVEND